MSAVAVPFPVQDPLERVYEHMRLHFDGDLSKAAEKAARWAEQEGLARGPLWDEIGARALAVLFRLDQIQPERHHPAAERITLAPRTVNPPNTRKGNLADVYAAWCWTGSQWIQLGDMQRHHLLAAAEFHLQQAMGNARQARFYRKLAGRVPEGRRVRDVLTPEEILALRHDGGREV